MIPIAYSDSLGFRYTLAESRRADSRESLVLVPGPGKSRWWKLLLDWYPLVNVHITDGKIHHFLWENSVFLWPFSIAMLNYQRVSSSCIHIFVDWLVVTGTWLYDFSHHIGNFIIPTDELIFFRGVGIPPTSGLFHGVWKHRTYWCPKKPAFHWRFSAAAWPQVIASNWTSSKAPAGSSDGNLRHFAILKPSSIKPDFWILESMTGWWFQTGFFPFHIWDVILPIDELHHFSRWLLHHQPDDMGIFWGTRVRDATWELHDERWAAPQVQGGLAGLGLLHSRKPQSWVILRITVPIGSMYAIYGNIYHQYTPNVSIYIPYMDPMGYIMIIIISNPFFDPGANHNHHHRHRHRHRSQKMFIIMVCLERWTLVHLQYRWQLKQSVKQAKA